MNNYNILIKNIIFISFTVGLMRYIFNSDGLQIFYHCLLAFFVVLLFLISFLKKNNYNTPLIGWFGGYSIVLFVSIIYNNSDLLRSLMFYSSTLLIYMFYLSINNIDMSKYQIEKINKFIIFLVIFQIFASIYKYLIYGISESYLIGTFVNQSGQLSTLFPLFVIGFLFSLYIVYEKKTIYLILIAGFTFFAWGGGKRAFWFLLPVLLSLGYFIFLRYQSKQRLNFSKVFRFVTWLFISVIIVIYIAGRVSPSLNPEGKVGGAFNAEYLLTYAVNYYMGTHENPYNNPFSGNTRSRYATPIRAYEEVTSNDIMILLFGFGPDAIYGADRFEGILEKYGISFGVTGFAFHIISLGILGVITYFAFFFSFGIYYYRLFINLSENYKKAIALGGVLATCIFVFDFLFYSYAFTMTNYIPSFLFAYGLAILPQKNFTK